MLAYVAYALPPLPRAERAAAAEAAIATLYTPELRGFLAFVVAHDVNEGVRELDQEKLKPLLRLKYGAITDAVGDLGDPAATGEAFADFQRYLY